MLGKLVFLFEKNKKSVLYKELNKNNVLDKYLEANNFKWKPGEITVVPYYDFEKEHFEEGFGFVVVGAVKENFAPEDIRALVAKAAKALKDKVETLEVERFSDSKDFIEPAFEGFYIGTYTFDKYKSQKESKNKLTHLDLIKPEQSKQVIFESPKIVKAVISGQNYTRDLVNTPPNEFIPESFIEEANKLKDNYGFELKVLKGEKLKEEGFIGIYSVGKGSKNPPAFIHLIYKGKNPKKRIALVGKGLTFDAGGLDIKPASYMRNMKLDKAGAASVLGIMKAIGEYKPEDLEVHAFIGAAENLPSASAYKPDDILRYKNGKTVEVDNTDAEGRLVLADCLIEASKVNPDLIINMATLTGACMVGLGRSTFGVFSNDENIAKEFIEVAKWCGEKAWPLPLDEDLKEELKSQVADLKNCGGRYGGAITAALFLKEFVDFEKVKYFIHLDIAGPAFFEKPFKYYSYGASGIPVRSVFRYIVEKFEKEEIEEYID